MSSRGIKLVLPPKGSTHQRIVLVDRSKYPPAKLREIRADGLHR